MPRPNRNRRLTSLYLAAEVFSKLDALAERWKVTRSDVIRRLVEEGVEKHG